MEGLGKVGIVLERLGKVLERVKKLLELSQPQKGGRELERC